MDDKRAAFEAGYAMAMFIAKTLDRKPSQPGPQMLDRWYEDWWTERSARRKVDA